MPMTVPLTLGQELARKHPHIPLYEIEQALLRLSFIRQLERGESYQDVADDHDLSVSQLKSWRRSHARLGWIGLVPRALRRPPPLKPPPRSTLVRDRVKDYALTLPIRYTGPRKIQQRLLVKDGIKVSIPTIQYHLKRLGLGTKEAREAARKTISVGVPWVHMTNMAKGF